MSAPIRLTTGKGATTPLAHSFILPLHRTEPAYLLRCAFLRSLTPLNLF